MTVNGKQEYQEMNTIRLPITWKDTDKKNFVSSGALKTFPKDGYKDEMTPKQQKVQKWTSAYLYNNTYTSTTPLCFYLEKGSNKISIENVSSGGLGIGSLRAVEAKDNTKSYKEYSKAHGDEPVRVRTLHRIAQIPDLFRGTAQEFKIRNACGKAAARVVGQGLLKIRQDPYPVRRAGEGFLI